MTDQPHGTADKRRTYPAEIRRKAVMLHGKGWGAKRIGGELGIDSSVIKRWLRRYLQFGEQALQP